MKRGLGWFLICAILTLMAAATPLVAADEPGFIGPSLENKPGFRAPSSDDSLMTQTEQESPSGSASASSQGIFDGRSISVGALAILAGGSGVAIGLGWLWGKPLLGLFTRLRDDNLLGSKERRRVYDVLRVHPGASVNEIAALCTTTPNNVRYHLAVLRRHDRIRAFRALRTWRFVAAEEDVELIKQRILLESSPRLVHFLELVPAAGGAAKELVERARAEWGLPRSSTWHLMRQAVDAGFIRREDRNGQLFLRLPAAPVAATA